MPDTGAGPGSSPARRESTLETMTSRLPGLAPLEWIPRKLGGIIKSYADSVAYLRAHVAQFQSITEESFPHEERLNAMIARLSVSFVSTGWARCAGISARWRRSRNRPDDGADAEFDVDELPAAA